MKKIELVVIVLIAILITSCNKIELSRQDAQNKIVAALNLPQRYSLNVSSSDKAAMILLLQDQILSHATVSEYDNRENCITINGPYIQYNLGKVKDVSNQDYEFKTYDVEFDKIGGISINKENQTALVRFSIKITNITPFARSFSKTDSWGRRKITLNLDNPIEGELSFRKFDSGWNIETNSQGYHSLLEMIINTSNRK